MSPTWQLAPLPLIVSVIVTLLFEVGWKTFRPEAQEMAAKVQAFSVMDLPGGRSDIFLKQ